MSYFIFNGTSSNELGLIIRTTPFRPTWIEEKETVTVPGRASELRQGTGIYPAQNFPIDCVIGDTSKLSEIYSTLQGKGELILSTNPAEKLIVECECPVPQGVALTMAEMAVSFDCYPFAYSADEEPVSVDSGGIITNPGTYWAEPVVSFKVSSGNETASFTIGETTLELSGMIMIGASNQNVVTVDCAQKLIYYTDVDGKKHSILEQTNGAFFALPSGDSPVSFEGCYDAAVKINARWY